MHHSVRVDRRGGQISQRYVPAHTHTHTHTQSTQYMATHRHRASTAHKTIDRKARLGMSNERVRACRWVCHACGGNLCVCVCVCVCVCGRVYSRVSCLFMCVQCHTYHSHYALCVCVFVCDTSPRITYTTPMAEYCSRCLPSCVLSITIRSWPSPCGPTGITIRPPGAS